VSLNFNYYLNAKLKSKFISTYSFYSSKPKKSKGKQINRCLSFFISFLKFAPKTMILIIKILPVLPSPQKPEFLIYHKGLSELTVW